MKRPTAADFDQELLDLYNDYAHGRLDRRGFLQKASTYAVGGLTAAAILDSLSPNYALARQVADDDERIETGYAEYDSPDGGGRMRGYLARPAAAEGALPGVLVVHENRGLNPYIEDVVRRLAVEGFVAFGPDALTPLGGYPGNDDEGREMQARRDSDEMTEDFVAGARWLHAHEATGGGIGVVGFCYGGAMANTLAIRLPDEVVAAVPFYGRQPAAALVPEIRAAIQLHFAENDERVNAGWPDYEAALKEHEVEHEAHFYPGTNHGFHNDTTPRYDEEAAKLAWSRTIGFFNKHLKGE